MKGTTCRREAPSGFGTLTSNRLSRADQGEHSPPVIYKYALARIDYRARRQAISFNLSDDEREDLRHDMVAELLRAFKRFDPEKASRETFINRVLDRFVKYSMRSKRTRQNRACNNPACLDDVHPGFQPTVNHPRIGELDEQDRRELHLDLAAVIARMPERLQRVCRALLRLMPAEAAHSLGICRQSIYRNIAEIRAYLSEAGIGISENDATNPARLQM